MTVTMSDPSKTKVSLDDILIKFSLYKPYHVIHLLFIGILNASNSIYYSNYVFVAETVKYRCNDNSSFIEIMNGTSNNKKMDWCSEENGIYCKDWIYDNPASFMAEFNLACQEWKRTLVGTCHSFGYMVGLLIVGPLSDRWGRKTLIVITGTLGGICGVARSFTYNYWLYIILEFLEAMVGDPCSPVYMLTVEIVPATKRALFVSLTGFGFVIGGLSFPMIAWNVPYWRTLLQVFYTPAILFSLYVFIIDESPRWLLTKGKKDEAVAIIEKAAKMNRLKLDDTLKTISHKGDKGADFLTVLIDTFRSRTILRRFFVCSVWWIASTFVNLGLTINSVTLQGNKYVNYALTSVVDVPGTVITAFIMIKCRRKVPLIATFMACAVICLVQPFVSKDMPWLAISVYMAGKLMSSLYFAITYIYTSELFPTYTRNSMHALCSSVGRIGSVIAPQTPLLLVYWSGLPAVIFGFVSLAAGLVTFLVPDTADDSLPDTVDQVEAS